MRVGIYRVFQREGRTGARMGEILGASEGGKNRFVGGGVIWCVRGRGGQG